jgi:hypothetical protein
MSPKLKELSKALKKLGTEADKAGVATAGLVPALNRIVRRATNEDDWIRFKTINCRCIKQAMKW